ncbi:unnamed protein product [Ostreobium quekettii]|uniref:Uncharacterized protein n=1 Tax=Ostreobium quekettii TaxID=121088 RepID=A0A8S1IRU9_9CHLO|nr:unnamed protein product [Ostreobium quekettii]|eukprot:evm.model.scf_429.2 EVM.evm.TU.scf_429.2   scf_429:18454-18861(-)
MHARNLPTKGTQPGLGRHANINACTSFDHQVPSPEAESAKPVVGADSPQSFFSCSEHLEEEPLFQPDTTGKPMEDWEITSGLETPRGKQRVPVHRSMRKVWGLFNPKETPIFKIKPFDKWEFGEDVSKVSCASPS